MPEILYTFDPDGAGAAAPPVDAAAAKARLLEGNRRLVAAFEDSQVVRVTSSVIGVGSADPPMAQSPFAAVLSCSDARAPIEFLFCCGSNELFVVRVAGNVPGDECLGSLEFAAATLSASLRLTVVFGHTGCGAVSSAVDTHLDARNYPKSPALRTVVDRILPAVGTADAALQRVHGGSTRAAPGGRRALIESSVILNAALSAMTVRDDLDAPVEYGVVDLETRAVTLAPPPADPEAFVRLATEVAASEPVRQLLEATP